MSADFHELAAALAAASHPEAAQLMHTIAAKQPQAPRPAPALMEKISNAVEDEADLTAGGSRQVRGPRVVRRPDPRLAAIRRRAAERDRRIATAAEELGLRLGHLTTEELGRVLTRSLELEAEQRPTRTPTGGRDELSHR